MSLAVADERGEDIDLSVLIVGHDHINHLFFGVLHHLLAAHVRVSLAGTREQQTKVIVYLGRRTDGRPRVLVRCLLLDGDDRRQSCYLVYIGSLHVPEEVAGVCREGLDVPALSFGEDGVEGQRAFPRTGQSGEDGK